MITNTIGNRKLNPISIPSITQPYFAAPKRTFYHDNSKKELQQIDFNY